MIDLHIHTTASSDGQHEPEEIFEMSKGLKLEAIAFAGHNALASVGKGLRISREFEIEFIPCIEIKPDVHLGDLRAGSYELVEKLRWAKGARNGQPHERLRMRPQR